MPRSPSCSGASGRTWPRGTLEARRSSPSAPADSSARPAHAPLDPRLAARPFSNGARRARFGDPRSTGRPCATRGARPRSRWRKCFETGNEAPGVPPRRAHQPERPLPLAAQAAIRARWRIALGVSLRYAPFVLGLEPRSRASFLGLAPTRAVSSRAIESCGEPAEIVVENRGRTQRGAHPAPRPADSPHTTAGPPLLLPTSSLDLEPSQT